VFTSTIVEKGNEGKCLIQQKIWQAPKSTIVQTIELSLPTIDLSREFCDRIMHPLVRCSLRKLRISANFSWDLIFASPSTGEGRDPGLPNLYDLQEKKHVKLSTVLVHTKSVTGDL